MSEASCEERKDQKKSGRADEPLEKSRHKREGRVDSSDTFAWQPTVCRRHLGPVDTQIDGGGPGNERSCSLFIVRRVFAESSGDSRSADGAAWVERSDRRKEEYTVHCP